MLPSSARLPLPAAHHATDVSTAPGAPGCQALWLAGPPWRGKPTRIFAWLALPAAATANARVPGVVLVHGGGGSAKAIWAARWAARGFAAIAPDTCGCTPSGVFMKQHRHADGGPPGWGGFDQLAAPLHDQWAYHATAAVLQSRRALAALPQIDASQIGVTGNSWGGVLTILAAAAEPSFAWAAPVYGCGFLHQLSDMRQQLDALDAPARTLWVSTWDPSSHLHTLRQPSLWVNGSNDFAFPTSSWQQSISAAAGPTTQSLHLHLHHADGDEVDLDEVHAFANAHCGLGAPLARVLGCDRHERTVRAHFSSAVPIVRATALVARDRATWPQRDWRQMPARVINDRTAEATLPGVATACCLNLVDARGLVVSSTIEELPP